MKVTEKGTDRTAEAHIHVEGRVSALEEYGQYVDGHDKAICCYVPVEEGHKVKIEGRFSGTTLAVVYDVVVDGVCRKAYSTISKSVQFQKNKKVTFETVLYQMPDGVIDTDMSVSPYTASLSLNKEAEETVGTIELRVYITRQIGIEHEIHATRMYDHEGNEPQVATYKDVSPQFYMTFEKNCSTLDGSKGTREKKKVYARRPGTEPWAVFRFHYRSKESILDRHMDLTYDQTNKTFAKKAAHALELDPVPVLEIGLKPASKNDGEISVRTSSPPPPETPSTPVKGSKKSQSIQPKVVVNKKQPGQPAHAHNKATSDMAPIDSTQTVPVIEPLGTDAVALLAAPDLQLVTTTSKDVFPAVPAGKEAPNKKSSGCATGAVKDEGSETAVGTPKKSSKQATKNAYVPKTSETDSRNQALEKTLGDVTGRVGTDLIEPMPSHSFTEMSSVATVHQPADLPSVVESATAPVPVLASVLPNPKDLIKSGTKCFTSPLKKTAPKPARIDTATSMVVQKPTAPSVPATPVKRAPEGTLTPPPDLKRIKQDAVPPLTPTYVRRSLSISPSSRSLSVEAQVAEHRQLLQARREKRAEMAKKKAVLDERMAPYKQRMAEELERLKHEVAEEEAMMAEEEEDYKASEAMLAEFERTDGET